MTGSIMVAGPAEAAPSSKSLCKGFGACASKGRSHFGYASVYKQSFWNMRTGHNCTNYVAYRLTNGRTVPRPPGADGSGTWGDAARAAGVPVSGKPKVGSVAWWRPRHNGASKGGHVAYVEAVRKDGSIVISEDHLGGTFMWRVLKRKGAAWPSGFIHFADSDGSPAGTMLWAKGTGGGRLELSATSNEPDVGEGDRTYLVTVGGPRELAGLPTVESFTFTTPYFRFERIKTLATRGPTSVFVYALNTPGTGGTDTLLGWRPAEIG